MSENLRELEEQVEREAALLRALPEVGPVPATLVRVRAAVRVAADRARRERRWLRWARSAAGLAAAALIVFSFVYWTQLGADAVRAPESELYLADHWVDDWLSANESEERWTQLVAEIDQALAEHHDTEWREWLDSFDAGLRTGV